MLFSKMAVLISIPSAVCKTRLPQQCTKLSSVNSYKAFLLCFSTKHLVSVVFLVIVSLTRVR